MTTVLLAGALAAVAFVAMVLAVALIRVERSVPPNSRAGRPREERALLPTDSAGRPRSGQALLHGTRRLPWRGRPGRRRLARLVPPAIPSGRRRRRVDLVRLAAALAGIAVALLLGGWTGVAAGAAAGFVLDRVLRRLEPAGRRRRQRLVEAAELPLAADLLAVSLRGGAPVDRATAAVAEALPGRLGERLARVARMLRLGATPAEAWTQLSTEEDGPPGADRLVRAAVRSAEHGSALARALERLAEDLRADRAIATEAAARRAAVLIVLPLGLCFLPAFILAGLVPVIIAILGDVL